MTSPRLVIAAAAVLLVFVVACGGGGSKSSTSDEPVNRYAAQLCDPFQSFVQEADETLNSLDTPEPDADLTEAFAAFGKLEGPITTLSDDISDIDPPSEMATYHEGFVKQLDYAILALKAIKEGGFFAALTLPTLEATPEEPADFNDALVAECGQELADVLNSLGDDIVSSDGSDGSTDGTPAAPAEGSAGDAVANGNFELTVHSVEDPYEPTEDLFQPDEGNRLVVIEVSIENTSDSSQSFGPFDFTLKDAGNFEYQSSFNDVPQALNSSTLSPGDTVRGRIEFEVPENAQLVRLTYNPGFFDEGRIDIDLQ